MADRFWVGGTGNWSDNTNHWSATSGGSPGASKPTSADNVYFDENSFSASGQTVTIDEHVFCLDMVWTGATNTPALTGSSLVSTNIYGSLTLIPEMSVTYQGTIFLKATTTGHTITNCGVLGSGHMFTDGDGGEWTLQDDFTFNNTLYIRRGTLKTNNKNMNLVKLYSSFTNARGIELGSSIITLSDSWEFTITTNLAFDAGTSTIILTGNTKNFAGGGLTYHNVRFSGTPTTVTGNNTFNELKIESGKTVKFEAGTTQNIKNLGAMGSVDNLVTLQSTIAGTPFTLTKPVGTFNVNYCSIKDCIVTITTMNAYNSIDVSGNSGIIFQIGSPVVGKYWVCGTGDWSNSNCWSTISGGSGDAGKPSALDTVYFDTNSFSEARQIVTIDEEAICLNVDFTGVTNNPTFQSSVSGTPETISITNGIVIFKDCSIKDITASGGADFYAYNSTDLGGNTGWYFINTSPQINLTKKPVEPNLYLCKPDKTIIGKLKYIYDINFDAKLGNINELNFKVPYEVDINHALVEHPQINLIKNRYLVKFVLGNYTEYFIITNKLSDVVDDLDYKEVQCYSLAYEFKDKLLISYSQVSYNATQILTDVLKTAYQVDDIVDALWSIDYISPEFDLTYRSFTATNQTLLDFILNTVAETFGAIVIFDTDNRTISLYKQSEVGTNRGLFFDYGHYLESLNREENDQNFCTRLKCFGKDGLSIQEVNPTGTNYLQDYSYFMYPYEEFTIIPTFNRDSVAYKQDGTEVGIDEPRYETGFYGQAIMIEEADAPRAAETLTVPLPEIFEKGDWAVDVIFSLPYAVGAGSGHYLWSFAAGSDNYSVFVTSGGHIAGGLFVNGTWYGFENDTEVQVGQRYLVTLTGDGSKLRFFVNGEQIGTDKDYFETTEDLPANMYIGSWPNSYEQLNGLIDSFRVAKSRTLTEHQAIYNSNQTLPVDEYTTFISSFNNALYDKVKSPSYYMSDSLCGALLDYNELLETMNGEQDIAEVGTTATNLVLTSHGLSTGDYIVNRTRNNNYSIVTVVDPDILTTNEIDGQASGDSIVKYSDGTFRKLLYELRDLEATLTIKENELDALEEELEVILDNIIVNQEAGQPIDDLIIGRNAKISDINDKKAEIVVVEGQIAAKELEIDALKATVSIETNFTLTQRKELNQFAIEKDWQDQNYIYADDLFFAGVDRFLTMNQPEIFIDINIINFLKCIEEQANWDKLNLGDTINIKYNKFDLNMTAIISEMSIGFESEDINLKISNYAKIMSDEERYIRDLYKSIYTTKELEFSQANWNSMLINFDANNDRISTIPADPVVESNGTAVDHVLNDDGSCDISFEWDYTGAGDAYNIDGFLLMIKSSSTDETYVFGSSLAKEQVIVLDANKRAYILTGVPANHYYTFGIQAYRNVDTDISGNGILKSNIVQPSNENEDPYLPSANVVFNGDIQGTIDGTDVSTIASGIVNGQTAYDETVNYRSTGVPTNNPTPSSLLLTTNSNATLDIKVGWDAYTQGAKQADLLMLFWKKGVAPLGAPTVNDSCISFNVNTAAQSYYTFEGVSPADNFSFGIAAARRTDSGLEIGEIISSESAPDWQDVTSGVPNYTANIASVAGVSTKTAGGITDYLDGFGDGSDGEFNSTGNVTLSLVSDDTTSVIKQYTSFTLNEGHILTVNKRCRGLFIFCRGDVYIGGTIDLIGKAAKISTSTTLQRTVQIPVGQISLEIPSGGIGGNGKTGASGVTSGGAGGAGGNGTNGTAGCWFGGGMGGPGGAGGGGGSESFYAGGIGGNAGTANLDLAFGSGGTGAIGTNLAGANGGTGGNLAGGGGGAGAGRGGLDFLGGNGGVGGSPGSGGGGGSGANGTTNGNAGSSGNIGGFGGGLLVIVAKGTITIGASGVINCNGAVGATGGTGGTSVGSGSGAGGQGGGQGGGGGGVVVLAYRNSYTNDGSITVNGGAAGSGGTGGSAGSVGTIVTTNI
jgi:hypothetical protein